MTPRPRTDYFIPVRLQADTLVTLPGGIELSPRRAGAEQSWLRFAAHRPYLEYALVATRWPPRYRFACAAQQYFFECNLEANGIPVQKIFVCLIRTYQRFFSPLLPPSCRFHPTCSQYAIEAITLHGVLKGTWLASRRILRCHPFHPGGIDPVAK